MIETRVQRLKRLVLNIDHARRDLDKDFTSEEFVRVQLNNCLHVLKDVTIETLETEIEEMKEREKDVAL